MDLRQTTVLSRGLIAALTESQRMNEAAIVAHRKLAETHNAWLKAVKHSLLMDLSRQQAVADAIASAAVVTDTIKIAKAASAAYTSLQTPVFAVRTLPENERSIASQVADAMRTFRTPFKEFLPRRNRSFKEGLTVGPTTSSTFAS